MLDVDQQVAARVLDGGELEVRYNKPLPNGSVGYFRRISAQNIVL